MVDLDGVTFLPSMAVGVLMGAIAKAPGTRVVASRDTVARTVPNLLGLYEHAMTGGRPKLDASGS